MGIKKNKKAGTVIVTATLVNDYVFEFTQAEFDELNKKEDGLWEYVNEVIGEQISEGVEPSASELRIEL